MSKTPGQNGQPGGARNKTAKTDLSRDGTYGNPVVGILPSPKIGQCLSNYIVDTRDERTILMYKIYKLSTANNYSVGFVIWKVLMQRLTSCFTQTLLSGWYSELMPRLYIVIIILMRLVIIIFANNNTTSVNYVSTGLNNIQLLHAKI